MTSLHHNTLSLTVIDPRGLTVRNVTYHHHIAEPPPQAFVTFRCSTPGASCSGNGTHGCSGGSEVAFPATGIDLFIFAHRIYWNLAVQRSHPGEAR